MRALLGARAHLPEPPPDLVVRTMRRLPPHPPALAVRRAARQRLRRRVLLAGIAVLVLGVTIPGVWHLLGGPAPELLFGNGSSGLSYLLLLLDLLARPVLHTISMVSPTVLGASILILAGSVYGWWQLVRRTPVYAPTEWSP